MSHSLFVSFSVSFSVSVCLSLSLFVCLSFSLSLALSVRLFLSLSVSFSLILCLQGTNRIVSPLIDIVDKQTMKYVAANPLIRGGFGHNLHFKWDSLAQDKVLKHRLDPSLPIRTPAIAGGLFAVDRAYFERIGLYDDQMDIWGGENVGEGLINLSAYTYWSPVCGTHHKPTLW